MKTKKLMALALASMMAVSVFAGCTPSTPAATDATTGDTKATEESKDTEATEATTEAPKEYADDEIIDMTMFAAMSGKEKNSNNEIKEIIAKKTGVRVQESWLTGQQAGEAIGSIIASGKLPDLIDGGDGSVQLYEEGLLVPWDDYLEKYPNLKEMYSEKDWDKFRMDDGKIYWANVFGNYYQKDTTTGQNGEAFWIQVRVLEDAGYPKIETLDQYFEVIEKYAAAHPTMPDGTPVIGYTAQSNDWYYFGVENPPMFLDGYPNDGCVIVNVDDPANPKVVDYNTTPTAKLYFQKLNEEFAKGIVDPEFATQSHDEYLAKLATGRVLGLCDQYWDFAYDIMGPFSQTLELKDGTKYRLDELGCDYVPLGLKAPGVSDQLYYGGPELNVASGCAVTTSCKDPDAAFRFLSMLLDQEIHDLRFWGIKDVDYMVDENGLYYRTDEQRENWKSDDYKAAHSCEYSYCPQWLGMSKDGINRMQPSEQISEFQNGMSEPLKKCFAAYGAETYIDFLGSRQWEQTAWYPLWSWSNNIGADTDYGKVWKDMAEVKHTWLPKVIMSKDFEGDWAKYQEAYAGVNPQVFLDAAQAEVLRRLEASK
ncbi:MAG: sugar ABC transporter substrate-binding protein [Clostridiales bacterium]|nr:sugar ABC transporter substrate-binding protein [Clostridiales bacterium]